jgi:uncharacterized protein with ParB-like and HNH nuclease domain
MERGLAPFKDLVVGEKVFRIPLYQRNYSWEERQLEDLWDDLTYLDPGKKHYFGTILMKKGGTKQSGLKSFDVYEIIDGQQRITTVLIILKELIVQFKNLCKDQDSQNELEDLERNYLKYKDIYKLELLGDDAEFFKHQIIDDLEYLGVMLTPSQERLKVAKKFYQEKFEEIKKSGSDYKEFLTQFKKKIDDLEIIRYPVENDSDGVLIFETVNDRGKVLSKLDKTKSFMMHMLYLSSTQPDILLSAVNERFANIYRQLEKIKCAAKGDFLDEDAIQRYHFIIYEPTAKGDKTSSQGYLEYLKNAARSEYHQSKQQCLKYVMNYTEDLEKAFAITNEIVSYDKIGEVGILIEKLFILERVANFFPLLQASWMRFKSDALKMQEILRLVEVFTFRVYVVGRSRSDTGEVAVDRLAFKIHNNVVKFAEIVRELKDLIISYANDASFKSDLGIPEFFNRLARKDLKYLLFEYETFLRKQVGEPINLELKSVLREKYEIEHIWADNADVIPTGLERIHEEFKNKLGNLTITSASWNRSWGAKPFLGKLLEYKNSVFMSQRELSQYLQWGREEILHREDQLMKFALERWKI